MFTLRELSEPGKLEMALTSCPLDGTMGSEKVHIYLVNEIKRQY